MNRMTIPSATATSLAALAALAAALVSFSPPTKASYMLAPQYAGTFEDGAGADASFQRIANNWQGSAVLWNGATYGSGERIGTFSWGTGLWGQVDWVAVQQAAAGQTSAASGAIVQSYQGVAPVVNLGNSRFNECYGSALGTATLVPFFTPSPALGNCGDGEAGDPAQQNWTARYSGFIRITNPGEYNFGVLNDDGFFFRLIGAGGSELAIGRDYLNPPDRRIAFDDDLELSAGLYGFELGAWNRLGAGVVDLSWAVGGCSNGCTWRGIPTADLLSSNRVAEPSSLLMALAALAALMLTWKRAQLPPVSYRQSSTSPRCSHPGD
jgi:hypothetical protein